MLATPNPFHSGELEAQWRAGAAGTAERVGGYIRDHMPDQHRTFFAALPFVVLSAADKRGRPWITILEGNTGFVRSPDPKSLVLTTQIDPQDPLAAAFASDADIGMLGIDLATRRRNRLSGRLRRTSNGYAIAVRQSFGNCPQYINERAWHRVAKTPVKAKPSTGLSPAHMRLIRAADTMFIGSGRREAGDSPANGYDASHRGGAPGFVRVVDATRLQIPDYAGNNFFNTIGNLLENPEVALLFIDFDSGGLLHLSGRATIDWNPQNAHDPGAQRMIDVTLTHVLERPAALRLRWETDRKAARQLALIRKQPESETITSFYLAPADNRPLASFVPGQHLPIELRLSPHDAIARRSYSLSAAPNGQTYRLSVKREEQGLVSRIMHDHLKLGDVIEAHAPSGEFGLPPGADPVVLAGAGVGVTPLMAMLQQLAERNDGRRTWFLSGFRDGRAHAFAGEVETLARPNIRTQVYYSRPRHKDRIGHDYDVAGRISPQALLHLNAGAKAHYLLCGPAAFVVELKNGLEAAGVPPAQIHFETF